MSTLSFPVCVWVCYMNTFPHPVCVTWAHCPIQWNILAGSAAERYPLLLYFLFITTNPGPHSWTTSSLYTEPSRDMKTHRIFKKYLYFKNNLAQDNHWVLEMYMTLLTLLGTSCMPGTICKCLVSIDSLNPDSPFEVGIYDDCRTRI